MRAQFALEDEVPRRDTQRAMIATVLEPDDRSRVEAAAGEHVYAVHTGSLGEAIRCVRERAVNAVLVSPTTISRDDVGNMARIVREFPGIPMVVVITNHDRGNSERLLELGLSGVRSMIDLSRRDGWQALRALLAHRAAPGVARFLGEILRILDRPTPGATHFFETLVYIAPHLASARQLAQRFGMHPSTLMSRFQRAGLPSPKRYLARIRLVHAAALLELDGLSIGDVSYRLEYSSPQSFGRHVRTEMGITAREFRSQFSFARMRREFIVRLVVPYRARFRTFHPFVQGVGRLGQTHKGRDRPR